MTEKFWTMWRSPASCRW